MNFLNDEATRGQNVSLNPAAEPEPDRSPAAFVMNIFAGLNLIAGVLWPFLGNGSLFIAISLVVSSVFMFGFAAAVTKLYQIEFYVRTRRQ